jgi:tight adherence protein C
MLKVVISTFLFSTTLAVGVIYAQCGERLFLLRRLEKITISRAEEKKLEEDELSKPFTERVLRPLFTMVSESLARIMPTKKRDKLQQTLQYAGNPGNLQAHEFQVIQYVLIILLTLGGWLTAFTAGKGVVIQVLLASAGGFMGNLLCRTFLTMRIRKRQTAIQKELPEMLDLLTVSVDAGLGFDAALFRVVEKFQGQLSNELRTTLQEIQMGKSRREALKDLGQRTGVDDLLTFVGSMIQADQLGVSISKVIRTQAEQVRLKRRQRIEEKAMKAPVKMLIPLVFFIFPSIFIVLLGPAMLKLAKLFL